MDLLDEFTHPKTGAGALELNFPRENGCLIMKIMAPEPKKWNLDRSKTLRLKFDPANP